MYKSHEHLKQPENSRQKLWHYLKYERLLQIINDGFLYFSHITKINDKWEGLLTDKTKEELFRIEYNKYENANTASASIADYEEKKDSFYVNCWHMNDHESYLMWKVYGEKGCAIQTNYERLVTSFGDNPPVINGCVIRYIDYERDSFPIGNVFWSVTYKDLPYRDEKEFRLLYWKLHLANQNIPVEENGLKVKIDVNMLIDNIYINPSKEINIEALEKSVNNQKLDCEIKYSKVKE